MTLMRWVVSKGQAASEFVALEAYAESAGRALACVFSSSDEFEADLIRQRRAAGAYGRHWRLDYLMPVAAICAVALIIAVFAA